MATAFLGEIYIDNRFLHRCFNSIMKILNDSGCAIDDTLNDITDTVIYFSFNTSSLDVPESLDDMFDHLIDTHPHVTAKIVRYGVCERQYEPVYGSDYFYTQEMREEDAEEKDDN
jgi:hypothetical protein